MRTSAAQLQTDRFGETIFAWPHKEPKISLTEIEVRNMVTSILATDLGLEPEILQGDTLIKDAFNVDWFDLAAPIMKIENYFRMLLQEEVECDRLSIDMIVDKLIRHDQASIGVTYRKKQAYLQH